MTVTWMRNERTPDCFKAHAFVNGKPLCIYAGTGSKPVTYVRAELTAHGQPFGRVCESCSRKVREVSHP